MRVRSRRETRVGDLYGELRPLMFSIPYRVVGGVGDAEDIVQEAFLRFHRASADGEQIESPKAYLSAITTRLGIDHLGSAPVPPETHVGTWLPEPTLTPPDSAGGVPPETAGSLLMAFLVLLESLSPVERAVFLLREVFEYGYDEIARMIGKSQDNCRQIAVRARRQVDAKRPRFEASRKRREGLPHRFFGGFAPAERATGGRRGSRPRASGGRSSLIGSSTRSARATRRASSTCSPPTWSRQATGGARPPPSRARSAGVTRAPACCSARRPEGNASGCPARPTSRSMGS